MRILHLGCGQRKIEGTIGVDINPLSHADLICDLDSIPYPLADNVFDSIFCLHILEHLQDIIQVMEEIHRIGKPGCRVIVEVPYFTSIHFYRDPTHKHFFTVHTFDYFCPDSPYREFHYSEASFRLVRVEFPPPVDAGILKRRVFSMINRHLDFYEKRLAFLFPRHLLSFELEVLKE